MSHTIQSTHLTPWSVVTENRYLKYTAITLTCVLAFLEFNSAGLAFSAILALMAVALREKVKDLDRHHETGTTIIDKEKFFDGGVFRKPASKIDYGIRAIVKDGGSFERC